MKTNKLVCICAFLLATLPSRGQDADRTDLIAGVQLQNQGRSVKAVQVLTALLGAHPSLAVGQEGMALNALGAAYQDLGQYKQARRSYDQAISVLQGQASGKRQYAEALDNLGSLELLVGNLRESENLRKRTYILYSALGSRSGLCRAANNLAVTAFNEGKLRQAEAYLAEAFRQSAAAPDVTDDDLASMYNLRGRLSEDRKDFATAVSSHKEALRLWLLAYSPDYYKVALGYASLGQAEAGAGDFERALIDLRHAVSLEENSGSGQAGGRYPYILMVYARVLKLSGDSGQAALVEAAARAKLAQAKGLNETVSSAGLRSR